MSIIGLPKKYDPKRAAEDRAAGGSTEQELDEHFAEHAKTQECFHCGRPIKLPCVMRSCSGGEIFLHWSCARSLAVELLRDADRVDTVFTLSSLGLIDGPIAWPK